MAEHRLYPHFCMLARALELFGERWSLLIVRDLLLGPRRFTDLQRGLGGITPSRLTDRLRRLEANGIVTRQEPAEGREVWYRLTAAGRDLEPVVESLILWGIEHALDRPRPDESVNGAPVMLGTKVVLQRSARLQQPVTWVWQFGGAERYTIHGGPDGWSLTRGDAGKADVVVTSSPEGWARFLTTERKSLPSRDVQLTGNEAAVDEFARAFAVAGS